MNLDELNKLGDKLWRLSGVIEENKQEYSRLYKQFKETLENNPELKEQYYSQHKKGK